MTAVDDTRRQARQLRDQARSVRSQAQHIRAQTRAVAEATAATQDQIAGTIDRLADQQPHRAERLRGMSESARKYAARERRRLARHPGSGICRCRQDQPPAASQPASGLASTPDAAASTTLPDHSGDPSVIGERDRIAAQLQDTIIRRVFAAGLRRESAAGLTGNPQAAGSRPPSTT
jgi:hypothetical protein